MSALDLALGSSKSQTWVYQVDPFVLLTSKTPVRLGIGRWQVKQHICESPKSFKWEI